MKYMYIMFYRFYSIFWWHANLYFRWIWSVFFKFVKFCQVWAILQFIQPYIINKDSLEFFLNNCNLAVREFLSQTSKLQVAPRLYYSQSDDCNWDLISGLRFKLRHNNNHSRHIIYVTEPWQKCHLLLFWGPLMLCWKNNPTWFQ